MLALVACGAPLPDDAEESEPVSTATEAAYFYDDLNYAYYYDHSVPGIQVGVRVCQTNGAARSHIVDCMPPTGYALVGGGARTTHVDGQGALLQQSAPLDDYFWRARSSDHLGVSNHRLTVYAVGVRLLGVNVRSLRGMIGRWSGYHNTSFTHSADFPDDHVLQGGFELKSRRFIRESKSYLNTGWRVIGSDHMEDLDEWIRLEVHRLRRGYIEGFGALEVEHLASVGQYSSGGIGGVTYNARTGWALVGYGGDADTSTGAGRFLYGIGPNAGSARNTSALSRPLGDTSTGYTFAHGTEARRVANSHGLCSTGTALNAALDSCVADVCAALPSCCTSSWTNTCVSRAETTCGLDCEPHQCSTPGFSPSWWSTNSPKTNCYGYAVNNPEGHKPGQSGYMVYPITVEGVSEALIVDGLIPTTASGTCPDARTKVALRIKPLYTPDYHFLRRDSNGYWSHKFSGSPPRDTDDSTPPQRITNPETAVINGYTIFGGYFCACSDSAQGEGHTPVVRYGDEPPGGFENPQL